MSQFRRQAGRAGRAVTGAAHQVGSSVRNASARDWAHPRSRQKAFLWGVGRFAVALGVHVAALALLIAFPQFWLGWLLLFLAIAVSTNPTKGADKVAGGCWEKIGGAFWGAEAHLWAWVFKIPLKKDDGEDHPHRRRGDRGHGGH